MSPLLINCSKGEFPGLILRGNKEKENVSGKESTYGWIQPERRPDETAADPNPDLGLQDFVGWLPEPAGNDIFGRLLDRKLKVW